MTQRTSTSYRLPARARDQLAAVAVSSGMTATQALVVAIDQLAKGDTAHAVPADYVPAPPPAR